MISTKDMRISVGQTWQVSLLFRDSKGNPIDLTAGTVYLSWTADLKVPPLGTISSGGSTSNGNVVLQDQTATPGLAIATVLPAATGVLLPTGDGDPYFWDAWAVDSAGNRWDGVATSKLSVFPAVTRTFS